MRRFTNLTIAALTLLTLLAACQGNNTPIEGEGTKLLGAHMKAPSNKCFYDHQCEDGNPCTDDFCEPMNPALPGEEMQCVHEAKPVGASCDDNSACTMNDICSDQGVCGGEVLSCDDGNLCTDETCDPGIGCIGSFNSDVCDDGSACTTGDVCTLGACMGTDDVVCDDGNLCTDDSCDPTEGCVTTNNTSACDDGDACTTSDICADGACTSGEALTCDDGDVCTDDSCDPTEGCVTINNTSACDDGDLSTENDVCSEGNCTGTPINCDDGNLCTDDSSSALLGCVYVNNTAACDDGDICTETDTCSGGMCAGTSLTCDDQDVCTDDSCDPVTGCEFTNNTAVCDDGNACSTSDVCSEGNCTGDLIEGCCVTDEDCWDIGMTSWGYSSPCETDADCDDDLTCFEQSMCLPSTHDFGCDATFTGEPTGQCQTCNYEGLAGYDCHEYEVYCDDGWDDNANGFVDCEDEDCVDDPACIECLPQCDDLECGQDGCGGSCGDCTNGTVCVIGACVAPEGDIDGDCADGLDNDADGLIDCVDSGCFGNPACFECTPGDIEDRDCGTDGTQSRECLDDGTWSLWTNCVEPDPPTAHCFASEFSVATSTESFDYCAFPAANPSPPLTCGNSSADPLENAEGVCSMVVYLPIGATCTCNGIYGTTPCEQKTVESDANGDIGWVCYYDIPVAG